MRRRLPLEKDRAIGGGPNGLLLRHGPSEEREGDCLLRGELMVVGCGSDDNISELGKDAGRRRVKKARTES